MDEADFTDFVAHRAPALLRWRRIKGRPEPYLRAALANAAANRWRHWSRRVAEVPLEKAPTPTRPGHEQRIVDEDQVVRALHTLPPRMRAVLVPRFFDDMSEADVARALRCSASSVKSQTSRGLARLRELLDETGDDTDGDIRDDIRDRVTDTSSADTPNRDTKTSGADTRDRGTDTSGAGAHDSADAPVQERTTR